MSFSAFLYLFYEERFDILARFGIRKSGFLSHKGHGYFGIRIGEDAFEVLIPCYDQAVVKELLAAHGIV